MNRLHTTSFEESRALQTAVASAFKLKPGRITPKLFKAVKAALFSMEYMHHDVGIIRHDPVTRRKSIDRSRPHIVLLVQPLLELANNRLQVWLRCAGADNEEVGEI
ncbi:MAG: hypothetical protein JWL59_1644 [Chthoniobacteraceae bacterium]|nr:hypothetical protein [Chthoniobacteraceae bacterium]